MIPAVIALLSVAGAWTALRRNPLYSTRSALHSLLIVLLAIVALVATIIAAVNLTEGKSATVVGITMGAVVLFGTFAMIFVIQTFTMPKEAQLQTALPPSAKLVNVHRLKVYKWTKRAAIVGACFGLLGCILPGKFGFAAFGLGGVTLSLGVLLLPIWYMTSRNFDRALTALLCNSWIHWQYSQEQWDQWIDIQTQRAQASPPPIFVFRRDWRKLLLPFGIIAGGVLIFGPGSFLYRALYFVGVGGLIAGLIVWSSRDSRNIPGRIRKSMQAASPEAYFGHDGVFCDGVFTTWLSMNVCLMSASLDERLPRSLMFVFEKIVPNPYTGNQIVSIHQSVLIPPNAEGDLLRLAEDLAARCPKARIGFTAAS
jgi:hypothetical protein